MISVILAVLALFVLHTLLPAVFRYLLAGPGVAARLKVALGPRDHQPPLPVLGGRAERALANLQEALPVFLTLAVLLAVKGTPDALAVRGGWLFFAARALYAPAYLSGLFGLRSLVWIASWIGLVEMLIAVLRVSAPLA